MVGNARRHPDGNRRTPETLVRDRPPPDVSVTIGHAWSLLLTVPSTRQALIARAIHSCYHLRVMTVCADMMHGRPGSVMRRGARLTRAALRSALGGIFGAGHAKARSRSVRYAASSMIRATSCAGPLLSALSRAAMTGMRSRSLVADHGDVDEDADNCGNRRTASYARGAVTPTL
jgi:hypothetical protein